MGELHPEILGTYVLLLAFPFIGGIIAVKLRLPTIIGYIFGGLALGLFISTGPQSDILFQIANVGIILLLFAVGLEVDLDNLRKYAKYVIIGGIAQIFITAFAIFFLSLFFRFTVMESLFIGFAFALSSTAVIAKMLEEKGQESSLLGSLVIGILVLQDLAVIPLIIIFSALGSGSTGDIAVNLSLGLVKAVVVLSTLFLFGYKVIPILFTRISYISQGLLNLFTIFVIFLAVYLFSLLGLPPSMAAFVAGMVVGQTLEHYHIFSQIRPLRDIFAIFFFVFLGANIHLADVVTSFPTILAFAFLIIVVKFLVIFFIFTIYRFHTKISFNIGLFLSHVGEFSFILMHQGYTQGSISYNSYLIAITSVLLTISAAPLLINNEIVIYKFIRNYIKRHFPTFAKLIRDKIDMESDAKESVQKNHIIICGFGRVGIYIGRALRMAKIDFIAIDRNIYVVERARREGFNIYYGNPADAEMLNLAGVKRAKTLVSVVPGRYTQETIIANSRKLNPGIVVYSRVHKEDDQKALLDLGAKAVVQPEFETALTLIKEILLGRGYTPDKIASEFRELRKRHEKSLDRRKYKRSPAESYGKI